MRPECCTRERRPSPWRAGCVPCARSSPPVAVEAESGGGRISLWLTVDHPDLVARLVLSSVASETPPDSPMTGRMAQWLDLAERGEWADFFAHLALQLKPAGSVHAEAVQGRAGVPATPVHPGAVHR